MDLLNTALQSLALVGAVISIVFLARQIQQLERSIRGASYQGIVYTPGVSQLFIQYPELADMWMETDYLYVDGSTDLQAQYKSVRQRWIISILLDHYENVYIQHELGNIPDHLWVRWEKHLRRVLGNEKAIHDVWPSFKVVYYDKFVKFVDTAIWDATLAKISRNPGSTP
jgi:hypothetical protein